VTRVSEAAAAPSRGSRISGWKSIVLASYEQLSLINTSGSCFRKNAAQATERR